MGVTPRRLLKIQITQSSAEHNNFPELWPFPKIWAGTTLPTGAKCMTNPCLSKPLQMRAAARSGCKAGTLSLNFECKHGFIIRLFFWVIQAMPWLHWIKIKAQYFTDHLPLLTRAAAHAPQRGGASTWREAHREAVWLLARGPSHSPGWVEHRLGHTQTPKPASTATAHTAEPFQGKAESDGEVWGRKPQAYFDHSALSNGEKNTPLTATVWGWAKITRGKIQNRANNVTRAKDAIKVYIYLEDISKLVIGRQD